MTAATTGRSRHLLLLLVMNVAASVAHYADNIVRFVSYPEPPWLNPERVDVFWFVMTPFGIAAYWLYRRGRELPAFVMSYAYAAMNLLVLGHYLVAPPWKVSLLINALIGLEAGAATLLLAYTARLQASALADRCDQGRSRDGMNACVQKDEQSWRFAAKGCPAPCPEDSRCCRSPESSAILCRRDRFRTYDPYRVKRRESVT
jgi:hypothetical protein